jgi:hypothetical protein
MALKVVFSQRFEFWSKGSCPHPLLALRGLSRAQPPTVDQSGVHTVLLGVGQVEPQVVQVLQDLLQSQLGQLAAGASQAAQGPRQYVSWGRPPGVGGTLYPPGFFLKAEGWGRLREMCYCRETAETTVVLHATYLQATRCHPQTRLGRSLGRVRLPC